MKLDRLAKDVECRLRQVRGQNGRDFLTSYQPILMPPHRHMYFYQCMSSNPKGHLLAHNKSLSHHIKAPDRFVTVCNQASRALSRIVQRFAQSALCHLHLWIRDYEVSPSIGKRYKSPVPNLRSVDTDGSRGLANHLSVTKVGPGQRNSHVRPHRLLP
jgi:hypothetical protein